MKTRFLSSAARGLLLLVFISSAAIAQVNPALKVYFINNSGYHDTNVWINWQNGGGANPWQIGYGTNSLPAPKAGQMGSSMNLKQIGAGGFDVTNIYSGVVYVSYGACVSTGAAPSPVSSADPNYLIRYQNFELDRTGNPGDQGDLTAINFFSFTMSAKTYHGGTNGTLLQSFGYLNPKTANATVSKALMALTANQAAVYDANNNFIRVIGPTAYPNNSYGPYRNFKKYLTSVYQSANATFISNSNAFADAIGQPSGSTNYNFILNFTNTTATADNSIVMGGNILMSRYIFNGTSNPTTPLVGTNFLNCVATIPGAYSNSTVTIYAGAFNSNTTFAGGWQDFKAYAHSHGLYQTNTNPTVAPLVDAYGTTKALAVGEITSGYQAGMINSTKILPGHTRMIKDLPSAMWWGAPNPIAFSDVQPGHPDFYNQYGNVIYLSSSNSVYGFPYTDRFTNPSVLFSTVQYNNTNVDTLVITLDPMVGGTGSQAPQPKKKKDDGKLQDPDF